MMLTDLPMTCLAGIFLQTPAIPILFLAIRGYVHGTHCAGIAAGATNNGTGIASISWNLKVMAICIDNNNTIPYAYDGIIYAAENGADIISNSWGSGLNFNNAHQEAVLYATGLGSIVLACCP